MQNSKSVTFALYVLLLTFGLVVWFCISGVPVTKKTATLNTHVAKLFTATHTDIPLLSEDLPQILRAHNNTPSKFWFLAFQSTCLVVLKYTTEKLCVQLSAPKHPKAFKILFPEHAFS